jgi:rubrerythrin
VKADQVPEGTWHCNMNGKVHYAAMKKGKGECPVCGMDLKEKGAK